MKKILYLGWIGFNNLGDELLWNAFNQLGREYLNLNEVTVIPSRPGVDTKNLQDYDSIVLGGGSLLLPGYMRILQQGLSLGKEVVIWGSGMDWLDKKKLENMISGNSPSLENYSTEEKEIYKEVFSKAKFAGIRGPLSKIGLEALGVKSENIRIIGDPGVLLKPAPHAREAVKESIVAINWGTTYNRLYGANQDYVEDILVSISKRLIKQGYKILIYSVWGPDRNRCKQLFNKINDDKNVILDTNLYKEDELIELLSKCKFSINFKLHANMLSWTAGVPCVALGYRFKVFDLCYSLGLKDYVVATDSSDLERQILKRINLIMKNSSKIIDQYDQSVSAFVPLLIDPFQKSLF